MGKHSELVGFSLEQIRMLQFAIMEDKYSTKKPADLSADLEVMFDMENEVIGISLSVAFSHGKHIFLKMVVFCDFQITPESWQQFKQDDGETILIPKDFLAHLAMLTTGTTRGVLFAKTEGTPFSRFILPTLNVADMIQADAVLSLNPA